MRHIVVATDERFLVPTATTLRSLTKADPGPLTVWVLASGLSGRDRAMVEGSLAGPGADIAWVDMDSHDFGDTAGNPLGKASYFRLAVGDVLPAEVDKVLYLDTDIIVRQPLAALWQIDMEGGCVLAVRSVNFPYVCTYGAMDHWPELGLDPRAPYFNSGMMLVDLTKWRDLDVGRRCLDHLASPLSNGALADQEALNAVLAGHWREVHPKWNQQTPLLEHNRGVQALYPDDVIEEARVHPVVVHFLDRPKPWHRDCRHPYRDAWRAVADETEFAPIVLERKTTLRKARWRVKRAASALVKGR